MMGGKENKDSSQQGFYLVNLATGILVAGLLTAGFMHVYNLQEAQRQKESLNAAVFTVTEGVAKYFSRNAAYPCPAPINVSINNNNHGVATDCTDTSVAIDTCANGYCVADGGGGKRVRIGAVPFRDMRIGKEDIVDPYRNRFLYAVTEAQAVPGGYVDGNGAITLRTIDTAGVPTDEIVDFLFLSPGRNRLGAYSRDGQLTAVCDSIVSRDAENCDGDALFVKAPYSIQEGNVEYYDDYVVNDLWDWVYIWDETVADSQNIYNRNKRNMGIGTQTPAEKLHVAAGNLKVEDGKVDANEVCNEGAGSCFSPSKLGGTGMVCPSGEFMTGIANGDPICVTALGNSNGGCGGDSFVSGFTYNSATKTMEVECTDAINGGTTTVGVN